MPLPIKMVRERDSLDGLFNFVSEDEASTARGLSVLQQAFLSTQAGESENRVAARKPVFAAATLELLERIHKNEDEIVTAASEAAGVRDASEMYRVPQSISDYDLTALRAQGLIEGRGRVVAFSDTAKIALRDHWLKQPSILAQNRTKTRFVHPDSHDYIPARRASTETRLRRFAASSKSEME